MIHARFYVWFIIVEGRWGRKESFKSETREFGILGVRYLRVWFEQAGPQMRVQGCQGPFGQRESCGKGSYEDSRSGKGQVRFTDFISEKPP